VLRLRIHLIEGKDLVAMDYNGKSDPYVIFKTGAAEAKSKIEYKTLTPKYDQFFTMRIKDHSDTLLLDIYDHDLLTKDDMMGQGTFSLSTLKLHQPEDTWVKLTLNGADAGQIHLELTIITQDDEDDF